VLAKGKVRSPHEWEKQTSLRRAHRSGYDVAYVCTAQRRTVARCSLGAVSGHSWSVGDLRFALREAEISVLPRHKAR
jgi:hypothetical protein